MILLQKTNGKIDKSLGTEYKRTERSYEVL